MIKAYTKNHHHQNHQSIFTIVREAILKRKVLLLSLAVLLVTLPILYLVYKYQPKAEAAWFDDSFAYRQRVDTCPEVNERSEFYFRGKVLAHWIEKNISRRMTKIPLLRTPFNQSRQSHKKQQDYHQKTGYVKQKEPNISLIKFHMLLTTKIDNNQQIILTPIPNITTRAVGLSSEGIKAGTTVEPKNKVPTLMKISANLSIWPAERMENLNLAFGISENYKTNFG